MFHMELYKSSESNVSWCFYFTIGWFHPFFIGFLGILLASNWELIYGIPGYRYTRNGTRFLKTGDENESNKDSKLQGFLQGPYYTAPARGGRRNPIQNGPFHLVISTNEARRDMNLNCKASSVASQTWLLASCQSHGPKDGVFLLGQQEITSSEKR